MSKTAPVCPSNRTAVTKLDRNGNSLLLHLLSLEYAETNCALYPSAS